MHDVIGHALTVSLLHVSSARLALDEDPAEAKASLAEAERLAQQSLAEVRAAVGLMRDHDPSQVAPMPGAGDVVDAGGVVPAGRYDGRARRRRRPRLARRHPRARGLPDRAGGAHQRHPARRRAHR